MIVGLRVGGAPRSSCHALRNASAKSAIFAITLRTSSAWASAVQSNDRTGQIGPIVLTRPNLWGEEAALKRSLEKLVVDLRQLLQGRDLSRDVSG